MPDNFFQLLPLGADAQQRLVVLAVEVIARVGGPPAFAGTAVNPAKIATAAVFFFIGSFPVPLFSAVFLRKPPPPFLHEIPQPPVNAAILHKQPLQQAAVIHARVPGNPLT